MPFDLSVCVINHRTPVLTHQCVRSVLANHDGLDIEVYVVNNTPDDAEVIQDLATDYSTVHVLTNDQPLGFSANQNQMFTRASGRYLMSLNSDTLVQPGALAELVHCMDHFPRTGMCGPKLIYPNGRLQPSCRNFPTSITHFIEASGLIRILKSCHFAGRWYFLASPHDHLRRVDWLTGACLIVRTEAAKQVGYYNSEMFPGLYGEDMEWCWRMHAAGWHVMFDPYAVVTHLESQSPLGDRTVAMYRGFYTFCARHYPRSRQALIRLATVLALMPRWFLTRDDERRRTYGKLMRLPMSSRGIE